MGFRAAHVPPGAWKAASDRFPISRWAARLRIRADGIARNRLSFFSLDDVFLGDPIDWNKDHETGKRAPARLSNTIDYRDVRVAGDAKVVWEPNRHHQLVVLGRAFRAFGEARYAEAVYRQIGSWIEANRFGYGMNWRSPLELGVRLINWVWALDYIRESGAEPPGVWEKILETVYRHVWEISRKYSRGSSRNNHVIGEAAGVFVGCAYFPELPRSKQLLEESRAILEAEIMRQTYNDGGSREQAFGYHLFVLQLFLIAGLVARWIGMDFGPPYWERCRKMLDFAAALAEGGDPPNFGDCDDGFVLDLAGGGCGWRELLGLGAALCNDPYLGLVSGGCGEAAYWLLGPEAQERFGRVQQQDTCRPLCSIAFPETGLYLLQRGRLGSEDSVSLIFDCAELGYGPIAAHGHADALSFTLRVGGRDVFVDPGTFDYFSWPSWRNYFRSTAAHNTFEVDGRSQSEILGPFLWGRRATARCLRFERGSDGAGGVVEGEHDGYRFLPDPVFHRRALFMDGETGAVTVTDELRARRAHDVCLRFHLSDACAVHRVTERRLRIETGPATVWLDTDPKLSLSLVRGEGESPSCGWISKGYHQKAATTTIVLAGRIGGNTVFRQEARLRAGAG